MEEVETLLSLTRKDTCESDTDGGGESVGRKEVWVEKMESKSWRARVAALQAIDVAIHQPESTWKMVLSRMREDDTPFVRLQAILALDGLLSTLTKSSEGPLGEFPVHIQEDVVKFSTGSHNWGFGSLEALGKVCGGDRVGLVRSFAIVCLAVHLSHGLELGHVDLGAVLSLFVTSARCDPSVLPPRRKRPAIVTREGKGGSESGKKGDRVLGAVPFGIGGWLLDQDADPLVRAAAAGGLSHVGIACVGKSVVLVDHIRAALESAGAMDPVKRVRDVCAWGLHALWHAQQSITLSPLAACVGEKRSFSRLGLLYPPQSFPSSHSCPPPAPNLPPGRLDTWSASSASSSLFLTLLPPPSTLLPLPSSAPPKSISLPLLPTRTATWRDCILIIQDSFLRLHTTLLAGRQAPDSMKWLHLLATHPSTTTTTTSSTSSTLRAASSTSSLVPLQSPPRSPPASPSHSAASLSRSTLTATGIAVLRGLWATRCALVTHPSRREELSLLTLRGLLLLLASTSSTPLLLDSFLHDPLMALHASIRLFSSWHPHSTLAKQFQAALTLTPTLHLDRDALAIALNSALFTLLPLYTSPTTTLPPPFDETPFQYEASPPFFHASRKRWVYAGSDIPLASPTTIPTTAPLSPPVHLLHPTHSRPPIDKKPPTAATALHAIQPTYFLLLQHEDKGERGGKG